jgi:hypothetical protein
MIEKLLSPEVQIFIKDRQGDDPFLLSLNAKEADDFPVPERPLSKSSRFKKPGHKLPSWATTEGIGLAAS